jgi:hypothetical protein
MWMFMGFLYRDEAQFGKLQQLGMTSSDETKLMAMREYIFKLANATSRYSLSWYTVNTLMFICI